MSGHGIAREREVSRRSVLQASALAFAATMAPWGAATALAAPAGLADEDGYDLWLRYHLTADPGRLREYRAALTSVARQGAGAVLANAEAEVRRAIEGLTGTAPATTGAARAAVVLGTLEGSSVVRTSVGRGRLKKVGDQGFVITTTGLPGGGRRVVVAGNTDRGVLAGAFHLVRLLQLETPLARLSADESPRTPLRMMNHWDNLDGSIERGYAGTSIFDWDALPEVSDRVVDYARAMASVGVNASVVNNVNANVGFITSDMLPRLAPLAKLFASWGISLWVSVNYASPMLLTADDADPITTADPADARVRAWWRDKCAEIVAALPGFGGFLVKANSEGRPGPLDYGRTHAEGANMLAEALAPHDGLVIWRSFVHEDFGDWAEYQYRQFAPLDGEFDDNVIVQTKYGPIDFQVREPVHPLFGELRDTHQMLELQLTQEYTGHEIHACYLAPMWREVLSFRTGGPGTGPTVADVVTAGPVEARHAGIAGVSSFGDDRDWTGYQLGAANTYAFGRLCWDPGADPRDLATEWVRLTFGTDDVVTATVVDVLMRSRATYEDYSSPLGLGYLTNPGGSHLDPDPLSTLYQSHHTTSEGTGFDRTAATGSGFTGLYPPGWADVYGSLEECPDELLLFMHWVPYGHRLRSGKTVIQHLYDTHFTGVEHAAGFADAWRSLAGKVDGQRHDDVAASFAAQVAHATLWRDVVVGFFFDQGRVVDERREWLQVAPAGSRLLLGGRQNLLPVAVTNASARAHDTTVTLTAPSGWATEPATRRAASAETVEVDVPVAPPLEADAVPFDVDVAPALQRLDGRGTTLVVAPAGARCHLALNGGPAGGVPAPGYTALTPASAWSEAAGFGWVGSAPSARDRGGDPLLRDHLFHSSARVLRVAVPPGTHTARLLVGDTGSAASATRVAVDGTTVATGEKLDAGAFAWLDLPLDGGAEGRTADLTLTGQGGPWRLTALTIADADAPEPSLLALRAIAEPVWWTGRPNDVTVQVRNTGTADREVTASLVVPDGWTASDTTVTVPAGQDVEVTVAATPPAAPTLAVVEVRLISGDEEVERGRAVEVITTPHADDAALAFDAGTPSSPLVAGYTRLSPQDVFSEAAGYGWTGDKPDHRDRGNADALRRDIVMQKVKPSSLRIPVPAGKHTVWVLSGDSLTDAGITTISEGGTVLGASGDTSLPSRSFVWFSFELDGGASGRGADLDIVGSTLNGLWRIAALVVV
ncbi:alpha-glucuronidase family glycosyl hydrolase [Isoptericola sp. NPDC058082]|uniref:alpha-glucuronidase family glycosyl hydrolase n=1 Tax=Isoptericola sp. NPDC058082 TaxID=3346331 RepID=UPI0036E9E4FF